MTMELSEPPLSPSELQGIRDRVKKLPQPQSEPSLWSDVHKLLAMIDYYRYLLEGRRDSRGHRRSWRPRN